MPSTSVRRATPVLAALAVACAPHVHPGTVEALVQVESASNPYAIGVVGGYLARQPRTRSEAVASALRLQADGVKFSVGLAQLNVDNLANLRYWNGVQTGTYGIGMDRSFKFNIRVDL